MFQSRYFLRVLVSIIFLAASAASLAPKPALASMGPPMSPYYRMPFYPAGYQQCGMTGQMAPYGQCGVNPMAVFYGLNWSGASPLGASYMTPIGLSTMMNSYNHSRISGAMSAY